MSSTDSAFIGSIPEIYDRRLGPFVFEPYARDLARRLPGSTRTLLETAAGTGIVTRALAQGLPGAQITATDLNPTMLEHAARKPGLGAVEWRQADAQSLPFADGAFEAVVCQFGVTFFPDKARAFAEARRVLRPGGCFLFSVWDRIEENEASYAIELALDAEFPGDPPRFLRRTPHGWHDTERLRALLSQAGFGDVTIEMVAKRGQAPSAEDPAVGFCHGSPMRAEIEAHGEGALERATAAAQRAVAARFGEGPIDTKLQAFVIAATA
jgi:ubiquinone/menaquinone biosynthesis C-methylase UbiE